MLDRFSAQIRIGGKVSNGERLYPDDDDPTTILQGLIRALATDGASHEYGDAPISDSCTEAELLENYMDGNVLHLKNDQACNGEFQETEQFCIDNDIPFDRHSDHHCKYDAENVQWRPGMTTPVIQYSDSNGKEVVDGDTVRQALVLLEFTPPDVFNAIRYLYDCCPQLPSKLESFELLDMVTENHPLRG